MIQDIDIGKMGFRVPGASTGLFLGGAIYTTLKILVPPNDHLLTALRESAEIWALLPLAFLVSLSAIKAYRGRLWKRNASLQSLRDMPYLDFRLLIAESLRRDGFAVEERSGFDADQIDLVLYKDGRRVAVLCRHWESEAIDSLQVKELHERMLKDGANAALYITTGHFTPEACDLAQSQAVVLADGNYLLDLVNSLRVDERYEAARYLRRASLEPTY